MDRPEHALDRPGLHVRPIDEAAALARVDGDADLLAELIELFLQDAPVLVDEVRDAVRQADAAHLMRSAHRLKGSVATLGAVRVSEAALALETLARAGTLEGAASGLAELEDALTEALPVLQTVCARAGRSAV